MGRFVIVFHVFLVCFFGAEAQKPHNLLDTVQLEEIVHYGEIKKYQSGAKINHITEGQISLVQEGGIDNVLQRFTPIYVKSNAGGLSTIHFRGTSPDHTSINFGGINLNSLTLGHANLSSIPSFLFDGITLQYGSSSAVNGSGAIGGAIYLRLSNNWTNGFRASTKTTIGSFGEYLAGTKVFFGNGKWEAVSRIYTYQKQNNFPFNNPYSGNIANSGPVRDVQHGASINNKGLLQEINYRFNVNQFINSSFWIDNNWYQVQPNMQSNYNFDGTQEIENSSIRFWSEYTNNRHKINFRGGGGYVHDMQLYDNISTQQIGTDRLIAEIQASTDLRSGLGLKAGAKYKYINPDVHAYADSVIKFEQHFDIFLSSFYKVTRNLKFSLNLRQMFVSNFNAPFTPSVGAGYLLRTGNYAFIKINASAARSFRVPTFNDRYWGTQGNPDLKPEMGKNFELGGSFNNENNGCRSTLGINAFYMDIDNWIEWRNFGVWQAQNVLQVVSKGFEFQGNTCITAGQLKSDLGVNYTINLVEPVKTIEQNGLLNRQMNYVPEHIANGFLSLTYKKYRFFFDGQYTGERFTDDFGHTLSGYFVANAGFEYLWNFGKHTFDFTFSSNNILNTDYQNEKYYAMPGRNFRFSVKYDLNFIQ